MQMLAWCCALLTQCRRAGLPAGQEPKGTWYCPGCSGRNRAAPKQGKRAKLGGGGAAK